MRKFLLKLLVRCSVPLSLVLALFGTGGCSGGDGERQALAGDIAPAPEAAVSTILGKPAPLPAAGEETGK